MFDDWSPIQNRVNWLPVARGMRALSEVSTASGGSSGERPGVA